MNFSFRISEGDFLTFQMYTISKSLNVRKKLLRGRIFATIMGLVLAFNLFISDALYAGFGMILGAVLIYYYYPQYHKWRMKRNYTKYIKAAHSERIGKEEELSIHSNGILSKNISGEGQIPKSDLTLLTEIPELFLLGMKNGSSIIIPKTENIDVHKLKSSLKKIGVDYVNELDWKY